ncbi:hypothetical protein [Ruegeria atlantica]|uniref:hypothetical protein n=1 Tax=Ruegeria atlantica TaxID=81569 RepID=UPI00147FA254|nr:hypothetical protein [Ruegeria atlantica]
MIHSPNSLPHMHTAHPMDCYDIRACRALWQAVLLRLVRDLVSNAPNAVREEAERWVGPYPSRAFREVCDRAGLDADHIHRSLRGWIDNGTISSLTPTLGGMDAWTRSHRLHSRIQGPKEEKDPWNDF